MWQTFGLFLTILAAVGCVNFWRLERGFTKDVKRLEAAGVDEDTRFWKAGVPMLVCFAGRWLCLAWVVAYAWMNWRSGP